MHLAMPPRKTSRPPAYDARNQGRIPIPPALKNLLRSRAGRLLAGGILGFFVLVWMLSGSGGTTTRKGTKVGGWTTANIPKPKIGSGPPVVIVTVVDPKMDPTWTAKIKKNREVYAKKHGMLHASGQVTAKIGRILTSIRLSHLLPNQQSVPYRQLPSDLVSRACGPPCHDTLPHLHVHVVS